MLDERPNPSLLLASTAHPPASLWAHAPRFLVASPLLIVPTTFTCLKPPAPLPRSTGKATFETHSSRMVLTLPGPLSTLWSG